MNRIMYDSDRYLKIPLTGSQMIAYYLNGEGAVPSVEAVEKRFPGQTLVPVDALGDRASYGRVADVETGDISPIHAAGWISNFNATNPAYKSGGRPVIYCNRSNIPAVREGTGKFVLGRDYYLWVATLDGSKFTTDDLIKLDTGPFTGSMPVIACQTESVDTGEYHYDRSVVYSAQWIPS